MPAVVAEPGGSEGKSERRSGDCLFWSLLSGPRRQRYKISSGSSFKGRERNEGEIGTRGEKGVHSDKTSVKKEL